MGFGVTFLVSGDFALFTRPEMKVERVSYDVPTPSSMVGLLSNIYWHPGLHYVIDKIVVYHPPEFINIRRNEVTNKLSYAKVKSQQKTGEESCGMYRNEMPTQRASLLLKDVSYGIQAHFYLSEEKDPDMTQEKAYNILLRRLKKGQHFTQPCLGCREFPAKVDWAETLPESSLQGEVDLGFMLYDLVYEKNKEGQSTDKADPRFYRPKMINGVIEVGKYGKEGGLFC